MKLVIAKDWAGPRGTMKPAEYAIPGEITKTHAKCCVADGAGRIIGEEPFPASERKRKPKAAPENKAR